MHIQISGDSGACAKIPHRYRFLMLLALMYLGFYPIVAVGQTYQQSYGAPTFTTSIPVQNGSVNLSNGGLHLEIPIGSFPQRGDSPVRDMFIYESAIWQNASGSWQPTNVLFDGGIAAASSWRGETSVGSYGRVGTVTFNEVLPLCPQDDQREYIGRNNFIWTMPDGTTHTFPIETVQGYTTACGTVTSQPNGDAFASDATGYHMYVSNYQIATVYFPDGRIACWDQCSGDPVEVIDTNGNFYAVMSKTDTVGRSLPVYQFGASQWQVQVPNSQGGTTSYTVKESSINVDTNFGVSGVPEYSGTISVVTELDLPDGTKYTFNYDSGTTPGHYGLLTSMTLPTGGTINYTWSIFSDSYGNPYPYLTGMTTPDGSWTFTPQVLTSCSSGQVNCTQKVTVQKPSGDNEVYVFALNGGSWDATAQYYNGAVSSANLLATNTQCFNFVTITNGTCSYDVSSGTPATNVTKSATTVTYPGTNISSTTEYTYDGYGNVTGKSEWNFYGGTLPTSADRTTTFSYLNTSSYLSANILNRPTSIVVKDKNGNTVAQTTYSYDQYALTSVTGVVNHDDTNYGTGNNVRGNVTQISKWLNTGGSLTTTSYYDTLGNVVQTVDPKGNTTTFSYTDNYYNYSASSPTNGYVTQVIGPSTGGVNHIAKMQYYFGSGLPAAACGPNFTSTCSYGLAAPQADYVSMSYDSINRLVAKNAGDGGQTTNNFGTSVPITNTSTTTIDSTNSLVRETVLDGLGRTSQTQTSSPQGTIYVDTAYDSNGRTHTVSNPHYSASSPTDGTTTYSYDGLDRVISTGDPSGGTKTRSYTPDANAIMVQDTDELGNAMNSWVDAFSNTVQVNLFPGSGTIRTQYTYDALNNLTKVDESGTNWSNDRVRTYTYDSLSRLLSITNPEANSHAVSYTYDGNGNVISKVNGRGTTATYQYDALNRLTSKSYNDGTTPTENFVYDTCSSGGCPSGVSPQNAAGRVIEAYTSSAQTFYSYDVMGRNAEQWQCTPVNCGSGFIAFTYTHNYMGGESSVSYNGNFTISQAYDQVGRITQLTNSNSNQYNPATLASISQFSPLGVPTQLSYGNGLAEVRAYNPRLQPTQLRVYVPPSTDVLNQTFTWGDPNYNNYDNGVLWGWAASGSGTPTFSRSYTYDGLNRLATMSSPADPSGCTGLSWADDAWANRTAQTVTGGTCNQPQLTINTNNQITDTGFSYDGDGNLINNSSYPYQYDAEDRLTQFDNGPSYGGANYVYDANGRRVEKVISSGQIHYFYDENGNVIVETDQNGNWTKDYVYMGGQHVAEFSGGQTYFIHTDHLGSTRTVTNYQGSVIDSMDYLPYGEQIAGGSFTTHKFTGYDRDSVSGLDYAAARYYNSGVGRFMSVDSAKGSSSQPQSYNRYSYVLNNPLSNVDPTGLSPFLGICSSGGSSILGIFDTILNAITGGILNAILGGGFLNTILGGGSPNVGCLAPIIAVPILLQASGQQRMIPFFILDEQVDCHLRNSNLREIDYSLDIDDGHTPLLTHVAADREGWDYYVTEHQTDPSVTPNNQGTSTGKQIGIFDDHLGQVLAGPDSTTPSIQTFTIGMSPNGSGSQMSVPIMWHDNQRRNSNSITVHNGQATVNGSPFPNTDCGGSKIIRGPGGSN